MNYYEIIIAVCLRSVKNIRSGFLDWSGSRLFTLFVYMFVYTAGRKDAADTAGGGYDKSSEFHRITNPILSEYTEIDSETAG